MDEARLQIVLAEGGQQPVEMLRRLRSALHGEPIGLVEGDQVIILVDHHLADHRRVLAADGVLRLHLGGVRQWRDSDFLPGLKARVRLGPSAIDADLAGPQQLLHLAVIDVREALLEPAVQPRAIVALPDGKGLYLAHAINRLAIRSPTNSATTDAITLASAYPSAPA